MTKLLFKTASIVGALLYSFSFTSCTKDTALPKTNDSSIEVAASKAAGKPNSLSTVSLKVLVHNVDGNGNQYNIQNDSKGLYVNGVDNVQAVLDGSGTFAFNTQASTRKPAVRWVTYNFNNPVDPNNTYRPSPSNSRNYHFSSGASSLKPFTPLQNLGVNGNPTSTCMYMGNSFSNSSTTWRVSFHKGYEDTQTSPTSYAVATRTKVKATDGVDEWLIQPVGSCSPNSNVAALRSGDGAVLYEYYNLPFYFTLTAQ